jgi:hypothetical protein
MELNGKGRDSSLFFVIVAGFVSQFDPSTQTLFVFTFQKYF